MTPQELAENIQQLPGVKTRCILLYGSAATGDHIARKSDYNILVVLEALDVAVLNALAPVVARWIRGKSPPPMLLTLEQLRRSTDVFPIELADIRDHHQLLAGENVLADLTINKNDLRLQLERELRTRLIALRQRYLAAAGRPQEIRALILDSLSTFLVLFRAALRLFQDTVPPRKMDALAALAPHVGCPNETVTLFRRLHAVKEGAAKLSRSEAPTVFKQYLEAIEQIVQAIDRYLSRDGTRQPLSEKVQR
jgi:hypothetical protein